MNTKDKKMLSFFKKRVSEPNSLRSSLVLPKNLNNLSSSFSNKFSFDEELESLESEFNNGNASNEQIKKILEKYAAAVEYHESINSKAYLAYKQRMILFLSKSQSLKSKKPQSIEEKDDPVKQRQIRVQMSEIFKNHEQINNENSEIIKQTLTSQVHDLQNRLINRKKSRLGFSKKGELKLNFGIDENWEIENTCDEAFACKTSRESSNPNKTIDFNLMQTTKNKFRSNISFNEQDILSERRIEGPQQDEFYTKIKEIDKIYQDKISKIEEKIIASKQKNTDSKLLSKLIEKLKINRETEINTVLMGERQNDEI